MGWEGTEVTPQIRTLIEDHHIGAILLTTKNLRSIFLDFLPLSVVSLFIGRFTEGLSRFALFGFSKSSFLEPSLSFTF
jgi:hypothetical protein